jgi:hypothetical protein
MVSLVLDFSVVWHIVVLLMDVFHLQVLNMLVLSCVVSVCCVAFLLCYSLVGCVCLCCCVLLYSTMLLFVVLRVAVLLATCCVFCAENPDGMGTGCLRE